MMLHNQQEATKIARSVYYSSNLQDEFKGLVGILSGKTCLCLQMLRSKSVEYSYAVYIC